MINVYAADIANLMDPKDYPEIMAGLSEKRKDKILRQKTAKGRIQSLGAGLLLKKVLERYEISEEQIWEDEKGKPQVEGIHFNLSHTNGMAICAAGGKCVGCDIERIKEVSESVANRYFSEKEKHYLRAVEEKHYCQEFFRIWTMRESYMKMTGEGLRVPFDQYEICREEKHFAVYRDGKREGCQLKEYEILGYQVTVCTEDICAEQIEFISVGEKRNEQDK